MQVPGAWGWLTWRVLEVNHRCTESFPHQPNRMEALSSIDNFCLYWNLNFTTVFEWSRSQKSQETPALNNHNSSSQQFGKYTIIACSEA